MTPEQIIRRLVGVFGEPSTPHPAVFIDEYHKALTGLDPELLARAADTVIRASTFWPRPGEIFAEYTRLAVEREWWRSRGGEARQEPKPESPKEDRGPAWQARQEAIMAEFRASMKAIADERGSPDMDWARGQRPAFLRMRRESPNVGLHRARQAVGRAP